MFFQLKELVRSFACLGFIAAIAIAPSACSDDETATCVDSKCAAGNKCIALDGQTKCRKTCTSNVVAKEACPYGYACSDNLSGSGPFCVESAARTADNKPLAPKAGQWGQTCQPNLGLENPACDTGQSFYCLAATPTDATAYCTRYDCTKDSECGPGFYCGKINQTPNIATAKRFTIGEVQSVCLKRSYCAPCVTDLDCFSDQATTPQHCVADQAGVGSFCAPECATTKNCPNEARCLDAGVGVNVCYPRAGVCVGDGSICSPCRADSDCGADGACIKGEYTTEKACAKKTADCAQCPKTVDNPKRNVGCSKTGSEALPKNFCVGLYKLGAEGADLGCWTPNR